MSVPTIVRRATQETKKFAAKSKEIAKTKTTENNAKGTKPSGSASKTTMTTTEATTTNANPTERENGFPESRDKRSTFYVGEQIDLVLRFLRTRVRGYSGMLPELSRNAMFELFARPVVDTNRRFEYFLCAITKYCDPVVEHARLLENCDLHPSVERRIANGSTVFITILASEDLPLHAAQCNLVCADVHREIVLSV